MAILVIKVGGSAGIDYNAVCDDVAALFRQKQRVVLVHGGSSQLDEVAAALGHPPQFVTSPSGYTSRWTDRRTLEIFEMVYCGQMNKGIVERLQQRGVNAVGLCGMDGRIWSGPRKDALHAVDERGRRRMMRGNLTGRVEQINTELLTLLLEAGLLPVLTPPAISHDLQAINVDGDRAAAQTAVALGAEDLVILSNVRGVLRDTQDPQSRIDSITIDEVEEIAQRFAKGRMRIKLLGAAEALRGGLRRVIIGAALGAGCLQAALAGDATVIQVHRSP